MAHPSASSSSAPPARGTRTSHKRGRSPSESRPISPLPKRGLRPRQPGTGRARGTGPNALASEDEDEDSGEEDYTQDPADHETDSSDADNPSSQVRKKGKGPSTSSNRLAAATSQATKRRTNPVDPPISDSQQEAVDCLMVKNYDTVSQNWTDHYITKLLASRKDVVNSRPPPDVLEEAMTLQARYRRRKKLLCLIGLISEQTLDAEM